MAKDKAATPVLETGMLSFARSLQPSEGLFWGLRSSQPDWRAPVEVIERGVRGQSSEANTKNPGKSNPQVVEAASVPLGCDGIELAFSLWVAPKAKAPGACDDHDVGEAYRRLVAAYTEKGGFHVLATLYAWNIANARFAWRNRWLADEMRVEIGFDGQSLLFDPARLSLETPATIAQMREAVVVPAPGAAANVEDLVGWIEKGLSGEDPRFLSIAWRARMAEGQEVFPSQEYLRVEKGEKAPSRVYAKLPRQMGDRTVQQASMHSQKIGAALRHIDIWHGNSEHSAIAVNPYGGVQETGQVLRDSKGAGGAKSFYALRGNPKALFDGIQAAGGSDDIPADVHFVVANLVRGGVFGQKADS